MTNGKLVELFELATLNGEMSPQSEELLVRIAEKMGEDPDEFQMWMYMKIKEKHVYVDYK